MGTYVLRRYCGAGPEIAVSAPLMLVTVCMNWSHFWGTHSAEILWKVVTLLTKACQLVCIQNHISQLRLTPWFILILSSQLCVALASNRFLSSLLKFCMHFCCDVRVMRPSHLSSVSPPGTVWQNANYGAVLCAVFSILLLPLASCFVIVMTKFGTRV